MIDLVDRSMKKMKLLYSYYVLIPEQKGLLKAPTKRTHSLGSEDSLARSARTLLLSSQTVTREWSRRLAPRRLARPVR